MHGVRILVEGFGLNSKPWVTPGDPGLWLRFWVLHCRASLLGLGQGSIQDRTGLKTHHWKMAIGAPAFRCRARPAAALCFHHFLVSFLEDPSDENFIFHNAEGFITSSWGDCCAFEAMVFLDAQL